eukprot:UN03787
MAQSSIYKLGLNDDVVPMDELLTSIALDINNLQEILDNVGTTSDTIDKRHEFNTLRNEINAKISKATGKISRLLTSDDLRNRNCESEDFDTRKYENELQQFTASLRKIVATAIKSFRSYRPHSMILNEHNERSPLLQPTKTLRLPAMSSIATSFEIVDETKLIEEEEEKLSEIHNDLQDMKQMFESLDGIVNGHKRKLINWKIV